MTRDTIRKRMDRVRGDIDSTYARMRPSAIRSRELNRLYRELSEVQAEQLRFSTRRTAPGSRDGWRLEIAIRQQLLDRARVR